MTLMLDSLGSTLSRETIDSFYTRYGKRPHEDSITISEAVQCLESELCRPASERKKVDFTREDDTTPNTPSWFGNVGLALDRLDFFGPARHAPSEDPSIEKPHAPPTYTTEPHQMTLNEAVHSGDKASPSNEAPPV
jgi:phosphatidylserine decarboxylase